MSYSANQEDELEHNPAPQLKISLIEGRNNRMHHLDGNRLLKAGMYFIVDNANNCGKWE